MNKVRFEFIDNRPRKELLARVRIETQCEDLLALKVKDLYTRRRSSAQPVTVGREDQSVDHIARLQRIEVFTLVQVPKHGDAILTTGGSEGAIW